MIQAARRASEASAKFRRLFSSETGPKATLERWLRGWTASAPAEPLNDEASPPTALSWARRRGPTLPETTLRRLFREQAIRAWDPVTGQVRRVNEGATLPTGARLLFPKTSTPGAAAGDGGPPRAGQRSSARQARLEAAAHELRASVLLERPDLGLIAINKPAGLAVQGGTAVDLSLDELLPLAFPDYWEGPRSRPDGNKVSTELESGGGAGDRRLRLAHRLDRLATGVLLLGVGPDGAARLGAAFSGKSLAAGGGGAAARQPAGAGPVPRVKKVYWAVVCREEGSGGGRRFPELRKGETGSIEAALGGGVPALTRYRVLEAAADGALSWLELEPVTGRKHQLRQHCSEELGAPILGDERYGRLREGRQRAALRGMAESAGLASSAEPPLLLHCRRMEVRVPGRAAAAASAPLPLAWTALLRSQGWPLPDA